MMTKKPSRQLAKLLAISLIFANVLVLPSEAPAWDASQLAPMNVDEEVYSVEPELDLLAPPVISPSSDAGDSDIIPIPEVGRQHAPPATIQPPAGSFFHFNTTETTTLADGSTQMKVDLIVGGVDFSAMLFAMKFDASVMKLSRIASAVGKPVNSALTAPFDLFSAVAIAPELVSDIKLINTVANNNTGVFAFSVVPAKAMSSYGTNYVYDGRIISDRAGGLRLCTFSFRVTGAVTASSLQLNPLYHPDYPTGFCSYMSPGGSFQDSYIFGMETQRISLNEVKVTSISASSDEIFLSTGQSQTISMDIQPANAGNKTLIWQSHDASVATVNASGKVTAVGPGSTRILVISDSNRAAIDNIIVVVTPPSSPDPKIFVSADISSGTIDGYRQLVATVYIEGMVFPAGITAALDLAYDPTILELSLLSNNAKSFKLSESIAAGGSYVSLHSPFVGVATPGKGSVSCKFYGNVKDITTGGYINALSAPMPILVMSFRVLDEGGINKGTFTLRPKIPDNPTGLKFYSVAEGAPAVLINDPSSFECRFSPLSTVTVNSLSFPQSVISIAQGESYQLLSPVFDFAQGKDSRVTYSVANSTLASVDGFGVVTASTENIGETDIIITSVADPSKSATVELIVKKALPVPPSPTPKVFFVRRKDNSTNDKVLIMDLHVMLPGLTEQIDCEFSFDSTAVKLRPAGLPDENTTESSGDNSFTCNPEASPYVSFERFTLTSNNHPDGSGKGVVAFTLKTVPTAYDPDFKFLYNDDPIGSYPYLSTVGAEGMISYIGSVHFKIINNSKVDDSLFSLYTGSSFTSNKGVLFTGGGFTNGYEKAAGGELAEDPKDRVSFIVDISGSAISDLFIMPAMVNMYVGQKAKLSSETYPLFLDADPSWSSDDDAVASVNENGEVVGQSPGVARISATAGGLTDISVFNILAGVPATFTVVGNKIRKVGDNYQLDCAVSMGGLLNLGGEFLLGYDPTLLSPAKSGTEGDPTELSDIISFPTYTAAPAVSVSMGDVIYIPQISQPTVTDASFNGKELLYVTYHTKMNPAPTEIPTLLDVNGNLCGTEQPVHLFNITFDILDLDGLIAKNAPVGGFDPTDPWADTLFIAEDLDDFSLGALRKGLVLSYIVDEHTELPAFLYPDSTPNGIEAMADIKPYFDISLDVPAPNKPIEGGLYDTYYDESYDAVFKFKEDVLLTALFPIENGDIGQIAEWSIVNDTGALLPLPTAPATSTPGRYQGATPGDDIMIKIASPFDRTSNAAQFKVKVLAPKISVNPGTVSMFVEGTDSITVTIEDSEDLDFAWVLDISATPTPGADSIWDTMPWAGDIATIVKADELITVAAGTPNSNLDLTGLNTRKPGTGVIKLQMENYPQAYVYVKVDVLAEGGVYFEVLTPAVVAEDAIVKGGEATPALWDTRKASVKATGTALFGSTPVETIFPNALYLVPQSYTPIGESAEYNVLALDEGTYDFTITYNDAHLPFDVKNVTITAGDASSSVTGIVLVAGNAYEPPDGLTGDNPDFYSKDMVNFLDLSTFITVYNKSLSDPYKTRCDYDDDTAVNSVDYDYLMGDYNKSRAVHALRVLSSP